MVVARTKTPDVSNVLGGGGEVVAGGLDRQRRHLPGVQGGEAGGLSWLFVMVFCRSIDGR